MATKDNLTMETKDGLTRDEAIRAIEILILRKDNVQNVAMGGQLIVSSLLAISISIFIPSFIALILHYNNPTIFISSLLLILFSVLLLFASLHINRAVANFVGSNSKNIKETMEKIAKDHNLEEFLNAISGKKSVWMGKQDDKKLIGMAIATTMITYIVFALATRMIKYKSLYDHY